MPIVLRGLVVPQPPAEEALASIEEGESAMPKDTKVHKMYEAIAEDAMQHGMSAKAAKSKGARIAQAKTGKSLATGKPPKRRG